MTDENTADQPFTPVSPSAAFAEILSNVEPMGDLSRFVIDDLTPEDEAEFYGILENC